MNELEYSIESVSARSVSLSIKRNLYLFIKRGFDIVLSLIGVVFLIPISVIIKLLIYWIKIIILFFIRRIG